VSTLRRPPMEVQLDALDHANELPYLRHEDEVSLVVVSADLGPRARSQAAGADVAPTRSRYGVWYSNAT
jgi:hypothetical protein